VRHATDLGAFFPPKLSPDHIRPLRTGSGHTDCGIGALFDHDFSAWASMAAHAAAFGRYRLYLEATVTWI
jgi:hypothetical protein